MTQQIQNIEEVHAYLDEIISRKFFWVTVIALFIGNVLIHCGIALLIKFAWFSIASSVAFFGMVYGLRECISALPFLVDLANEVIDRLKNE